MLALAGAGVWLGMNRQRAGRRPVTGGAGGGGVLQRALSWAPGSSGRGVQVSAPRTKGLPQGVPLEIRQGISDKLRAAAAGSSGSHGVERGSHGDVGADGTSAPGAHSPRGPAPTHSAAALGVQAPSRITGVTV